MPIKGGRHVVQVLCYLALQMVTHRKHNASIFFVSSSFLRQNCIYVIDFNLNKFFWVIFKQVTAANCRNTFYAGV